MKLPGVPPLLPQPMTNGLTAISRANCLRRQPSFRTADVHLFDIGSPRSGQGIGAHFSAYSFCASKKSKTSGVTGRAGSKVLACSVNVKIKTAGRGPQPPYSFDGPKEYAEKGLALRWALSGAKGRCFEYLRVMGSGVRLCLFISTTILGWPGFY